MNRERLIKVASGIEKADIVFKNVNLVNTISGEIYITDVALCDEYIAGIVPGYFGKIEKDCTGMYLCPGFIDGHVHIESSMVSPQEFAKAVLARGTTTVIADPHEIANVLGLKGIKYIIKSTENIPLDVFIMLPSCVPATDLETSGANLDSDALSKLKDHPSVIGLGEFMNYPGVINADPEVIKKLNLFRDKIIDGHAPMITGKELCAYRAAGVTSEHECTTVSEALDKLRTGMYIMIREGSATKNLMDLMPMLNRFNERFCFFSTDDRHPDDLINEGHIDNMVNMLVKEQGNIVRGLRLASKNTAEYFGLKDRGSIAPGFKADLLLVEDFEKNIIKEVYKSGQLVAQDGKSIFDYKKDNYSDVLNTVNLGNINNEDITLKCENKNSILNVIEIIPGQIITKKKKVKPKLDSDGIVISDIENDILKFCVFERHKKTGNVGIGFVNGIGLKNGAIGTSISHDSHNINVIGTNDSDILLCLNTLKKEGGGIVFVKDGKVLRCLPLPIAGLMSDKSLEEVSNSIHELHRICYENGVCIKDPFITMAFLALPVIPEIKLTDKGLVDVTTFSFIDTLEVL